MKYEQQHIDEMMEYSKKIGLDNRLIYSAKTKEQADELLNIQNSIINHESKWLSALKDQNIVYHDPSRDLNHTKKKIDSIITYIEKYYSHFSYIKEIKQLNALKERFDLSFDNRLKADQLESEMLNSLKTMLHDAGFSFTAINKGTDNIQALVTIFRDILRNGLFK